MKRVDVEPVQGLRHRDEVEGPVGEWRLFGGADLVVDVGLLNGEDQLRFADVRRVDPVKAVGQCASYLPVARGAVPGGVPRW